MNEQSSALILTNRYFIMRHGQSEANVLGLITSDPAECTSRYGITKRGREQARVSVERAKHGGWLSAETVIYCSDFKRAVETAELAREILGVDEIHPSIALRERSFGRCNGKRAARYIEIWPQDEDTAHAQQRNGVEGPEGMLNRLMNFINELETRHKHTSLLLVSHGDPLQVLQAAFAALEPEQGRLLKYIEPGEIRELVLQSH